MHQRLQILAAAIALCGAGCYQKPDYVEGSTSALDGGVGGASGAAGGGGGAGGIGGTGGIGGASGMGGSGGGGGSGGNTDSQCSAELHTTYLRLKDVADDADHDGDRCTYPTGSIEEMLLFQLIFPLDPPQPNPEVYRPDPICNLPGIFAHWVLRGGSLADVDRSEAVLCPRYCAALDEWIAMRMPIELECYAGTAP